MVWYKLANIYLYFENKRKFPVLEYVASFPLVDLSRKKKIFNYHIGQKRTLFIVKFISYIEMK